MASQILGAGSGQLAGLQFLQKQRQDEEQFKLRKMQAYDQSRLDEQRIAQEEQQVKLNEIKMRQLAEEERNKKQEAALLAEAYKADAPFRLAGNIVAADDSLASTYEKIAQKLAPTNPKASKDYMEKALELRGKAPERQKKILDAKQAARQERSDMIQDVTDQAGWDVARAAAASMGMPIPATYKDWNNPATKEWINNQDVFSKAGRLAAKASLDAQKFALDQTKAEADIKKKEAETRARDAETQAKRDNVKPTKEQSKIGLMTEYSALDTYEGKYSSAPNESKMAAAKHVPVLTAQYMKSKESGGLGLTESDAIIKARETIANSFDENGKFTPPSTTVGKEATAPTQAVKVTTQDEFNKLPSGALYINPADGKTYRKK